MLESRRAFLKNGLMISLGFAGLKLLASNPVLGALSRETGETAGGFGELIDDPKGILRLPKGFSYQIISKQGEAMSDGFNVPGRPDGMCAFPGSDGKVILVRNHEVDLKDLRQSPFGAENELYHAGKVPAEKFYDFGRNKGGCLGGTTTLVYNENTRKVENQYLSLIGTIRNCAGGRTPWNTWITCEEDVTNASMDCEKDHGYVFEVPALEKGGISTPVPLKAMGRFMHEAVAVDPRTNIVYLTEDRDDGLIYRFLPAAGRDYAKGGKLQVLKIKRQPSLETRNWPELNVEPIKAGEALEVEWIDIQDVHSPKDDLRVRGFAAGAARFARGEGMWFGDKEFYFTCTNGGAVKQGQIFRYKPSQYEGTAREAEKPAKLELFLESPSADVMKSGDNITLAPWGDLIVCEDDDHPYILGVTPKGEIYRLAEQVGHKSEVTGVTFSPSGKTLFFNIQIAGLTVAITGPWKSK